MNRPASIRAFKAVEFKNRDVSRNLARAKSFRGMDESSISAVGGKTNRTYSLSSGAKNLEQDEEEFEDLNHSVPAIPPLGIGLENVLSELHTLVLELYVAHARRTTVTVLQHCASSLNEDTAEAQELFKTSAMLIGNSDMGGKHFFSDYLKAFTPSIRRDMNSVLSQSLGQHNPIVVMRELMRGMLIKEAAGRIEYIGGALDRALVLKRKQILGIQEAKLRRAHLEKMNAWNEAAKGDSVDFSIGDTVYALSGDVWCQATIVENSLIKAESKGEPSSKVKRLKKQAKSSRSVVKRV